MNHTNTSTPRPSTATTTATAVVADSTAAQPDEHGHLLARIIARRSFCTLATTSPAGWAHAAAVVYQEVDGVLWAHVERTSRKARNIADNPRIGVVISYRKLPVGPPFTVHFQAMASIVAHDDPSALALIDAGRLDRITANGALDLADGCFLRVEPQARAHSFGPGVRMRDLARDPIGNGSRSGVLPRPAAVGVR